MMDKHVASRTKCQVQKAYQHGRGYDRTVDRGTCPSVQFVTSGNENMHEYDVKNNKSRNKNQ